MANSGGSIPTLPARLSRWSRSHNCQEPGVRSWGREARRALSFTAWRKRARASLYMPGTARRLGDWQRTLMTLAWRRRTFRLWRPRRTTSSSIRLRLAWPGPVVARASLREKRYGDERLLMTLYTTRWRLASW